MTRTVALVTHTSGAVQAFSGYDYAAIVGSGLRAVNAAGALRLAVLTENAAGFQLVASANSNNSGFAKLRQVSAL